MSRFSHVYPLPMPASIYGEIRWSGRSTDFAFDPTGMAGEWNGVAGIMEQITLEHRFDPVRPTVGVGINVRMAVERMPGWNHPVDQSYDDWLLRGPPYFGEYWWKPDAPYYWTFPQDAFEANGGPRLYASDKPFSMPPNIDQGPRQAADAELQVDLFGLAGDLWRFDRTTFYEGDWAFGIAGFYIPNRVFGGTYPPYLGGGNATIPGNRVPPWNDPPTGAPGAAPDYVDKHIGDALTDQAYVAMRGGDGRSEGKGGWLETAVLGGYVPDWIDLGAAPGTPENPFSPPPGDPNAYYTLATPFTAVSPPPQYDVDIIEWWVEPDAAPQQPEPGLRGGNRRAGVVDLATGRAIAGGYGTVDVQTAVVTPGGPGWGGSGV